MRAGSFEAFALIAALASVDAAALAADTVVDRAAVRYVSPETGGNARPRFLSEREIAFFARVEAAMEQADVGERDYQERFVRSAVDRLIARAMLSSLMLQRGTEPPDLPRLAAETRTELADRVGGAASLATLMRSEGITEAELGTFLYAEVRAAYYVDRALVPILAVTEDQLREAHRSALHPYRNLRFEDVRQPLRRWIVSERLRAAELEFLQGARARIKIVPLRSSDERAR